MKLFISWSGERSERLAQELSNWLLLPFNYIKPWMSKSDISAGERWSQIVGNELETTNFGIFCITPENKDAPWILFEAGAIAKSFKDSRVIPLLFQVELTDISGPLTQFQSKPFNKEGVFDVVKSINNTCQEHDKINEDRLTILFDSLWPKLDEKIQEIPATASEPHKRSQHLILEDIVSTLRGLDSRIRETELLNRESDFFRRIKHSSPSTFRQIVEETINRKLSVDASVLILAGAVGEFLPWLREVLLDAARDLKTTKSNIDKSSILRGLAHTIYSFRHSRLARDAFDPDYAFMILHELPQYLDEMSHRLNGPRVAEEEVEIRDVIESGAEKSEPSPPKPSGTKYKARSGQ